jgi:capsid protein
MPNMGYDHGYSGNHYAITSEPFDGEKNPGEIGPLTSYFLDYAALRARSWKAYLDSEIAQTVLGKFDLWVIGKGMKLRTEPNKLVLKYQGIELGDDSFEESVEAYWKLFCESKRTDFFGEKNLNELMSEAHLNSIIGGDVLVVLRYDQKQDRITVQLIDGACLESDYTYKSETGYIKNGIEYDNMGEISAFHVRTKNFQFERIPAKTANLKTAFLVTGLGYRLSDNRGIPLISAVMEKIAKVDRYTEATLGSAEERQKISYFIEHNQFSTGENPVVDNIRAARDVDNAKQNLPVDNGGEAMANKIAATTNKQAFNMPIGSKINSLESKNELYFKDFYTVHVDAVCATIQIPPNVATSKYDSNYSASRAAIKEWEHTAGVKGYKFASKFLQPIYEFWLDIQVLKNRIQAPGYIDARLKQNYLVLESYRFARFIGPKMPHIDPLKEVDAQRKKLGDLAVNIPLTTIENAVEELNGGDSDSNIEQFGYEYEYFKEKVKQEIPPPPANS